ncbi:MAG: hypothetical protein HY320_03995 [Armatimonadetes bacterium]|nr:hypothetical protein [Armatimonadota bacterium]
MRRAAIWCALALAAATLTPPARAQDFGDLIPEPLPVRPCGNPFLDAIQRRNGALRLRQGPPRPVRTRIRPAAVGDTASFWVYDFTNYDGRPETAVPYQVTARLARITRSAYVYVEQGVSVSSRRLYAITNFWETSIYANVRRIFGEEPSPGIDGDARIYLLFTNIPAPQTGDLLGPTIGGYFNSDDQFPRDAQHPYSNEKDMIVLNAEFLDPVFGSETLLLDVLAHEFQHLCQWNQDPDEDLWINEGMSMLAPIFCGSPFTADSTLGQAVMAYGADPSNSLTVWGDHEEANILEDYGAAGLLLYYLYEKHGEELIQRLARNPANTVAGVETALQSAGCLEDFGEVFTRFALANAIDDPTIGDYPWYFSYSTSALRDLKQQIDLINFILVDFLGLEPIPQLFTAGPSPPDGADNLGPYSVRYYNFPGYTGQLDLFVTPEQGAPFGALAAGQRGDDSFLLYPFASDNGTLIGRAHALGTEVTGDMLLVVANLDDTVASRSYTYQAVPGADEGPLADVTPPCASALALGPLNDTGQYTGPVTVVMNAADWQSGVQTIRYGINTGAGQLPDVYTGPLRFDQPGTYTIRFTSVDGANNVGAEYQLVITLVGSGGGGQAPSSQASLAGSTLGLGWYKNATLTLTGTNNGGGLTGLRYSVNGGATQTYTAPVPFTVEGFYNIRYWAVGNGGLEEPSNSIAFAIDGAAPMDARVLINNGARRTRSPDVRLQLFAADTFSGVYQYRVRNAGEAWSDWRAYAAEVNHTLPRVSGIQTVEVQYRDRAGNESTVVTDSIQLRLPRRTRRR